MMHLCASPRCSGLIPW